MRHLLHAWTIYHSIKKYYYRSKNGHDNAMQLRFWTHATLKHEVGPGTYWFPHMGFQIPQE